MHAVLTSQIALLLLRVAKMLPGNHHGCVQGGLLIHKHMLEGEVSKTWIKLLLHCNDEG